MHWYYAGVAVLFPQSRYVDTGGEASIKNIGDKRDKTFFLGGDRTKSPKSLFLTTLYGKCFFLGITFFGGGWGG